MQFTVHVATYAIVMAMAFPMEDFSDISIEELEDWNDLVLNPHDDEIGIHTVDDFANNSSELKRSASSATASESGGASNDRPAKKNKATSKGKDHPPKKTKAYFVMTDEVRCELQGASKDTVAEILDSVSSAEQFSGEHGYGSDVRKLACQMIARKGDASFAVLCAHTINNILDMVQDLNKTPIGSGLQDETFKRFHSLRTCKEQKVEWNTFLQDNNLDSSKAIVGTLLYQFVLETALDKVVLEVGKRQDSSCEDTERKKSQDDGDREAQILRYISGFIPYALGKRYQRSKQTLAKEYAAILQSWRSTNDKQTMAPSFLSYTVAWVEMQNRGGLFTVTDDVFRFFWALERISKGYLNQNMCSLKNKNLKENLTAKCRNNENVLKIWKSLVQSCSVKIDVEPLFISVVNYWVKIRIFAFVKAYNLLRKDTKKTSLKGEKSLRKELLKK